MSNVYTAGVYHKRYTGTNSGTLQQPLTPATARAHKQTKLQGKDTQTDHTHRCKHSYNFAKGTHESNRWCTPLLMAA